MPRIFSSFARSVLPSSTRKTECLSIAICPNLWPNRKGADDPPDLEHVSDAPQQQNGYDCGMYTVLLAEHIASEKNGASHAEPAGDGCTTTLSPTRPPTKTTTTRTAAEASAGGGTSERDEGAEKKRRVLLRGGSGDHGRVSRFGGLSPEFVSNARNLARERLGKCFRDGG